MLLISVGTVLKIVPGAVTVSDVLVAAGTAMVGIGAEHKARKLDAKVTELTEALKKKDP